MLDNNTVYFLNIIWTYNCTCMYYVSEINEYYIIMKQMYALCFYQVTCS